MKTTRRHAAWLLVAFLVVISFFAMRTLVERVDRLKNANRESAWVGASSAISLFVHELQRERGLSSGFSVSESSYFDEGLDSQQTRTDFSLAELELKLRELAVDPAAATNSFSLNENLESTMRELAIDPATRQRLEDRLGRLPELRRQIREKAISREFAADAYTAIVDALFDVQLGAFGNAVESAIYRQQMALLAFTQAKEKAGQERALLSAMLADRNFTNDRLAKWDGIKAAEEAETANFIRLADRDVRTHFESIQAQSYIREAERLRLKVRAIGLYSAFYGADALDGTDAPAIPPPENWFRLSSKKIDAMKALEDALNQSIKVRTQSEERRASVELLISAFLALLSFLIAGILIREIVQGGKVAEHQLGLADAVFTNSVESILVTDAERRIVEVNPAFTKMTGYEREEVLGQYPSILKSGRHGPEFYQDIWKQIEEKGAWEGEVWNRRKNGETFPALLTIAAVKESDGRITNYTGMIFDLSQHESVEALIDQLRTFDALTALPNRESWISALSQAVAGAQRNKTRFTVLEVDLDRFKAINDSLGFAIGDQVLIEAAERIKNTLRRYDVVARLGGNRFSVLLDEIVNPQNIGIVCEKLLTAFGQPFSFESVCTHATISIGVAIYPTDGGDAKTLMMAAESAMYSAKADGRNAYKYYSREMNEAGTQLFKLEHLLRQALERNEFAVVYQPQFRAGDGRMVGVEALLRWHNPELGNVSPVQFIPVAEETGLIVPIGEWVMRVACEQAKVWQTELGLDITVAVNLSARQFRRNDLLVSVQSILDETRLPSRLLELEITEGLLMADPAGATDIIRGLNFLGVKIALDDFGTGYSSLAYLKNFPITRLKIDRAFVRDLPDNRSDCAIANTVIALGLNLDMEVLAEGVETVAQRNFLTDSGCQVFQGYLFAKPMPGDELTQRLRSSEFSCV